MLKLLFVWPMMLRTVGLAVKAPTLFSTGATASVANLSFQLANSTFQKLTTTGSVTCLITSWRNFFSVSMRVMSSMVASGYSTNASRV